MKRVCVPRESGPGEHRVALVPETVRSSRAAGFEIVVERGAGVLAGFPDEAYSRTRGRSSPTAGSTSTGSRASPGSARPADGRGRPPDARGIVLVGFLQPLTDHDGIGRLQARGVVAFAMESIPRITRAQSMDALSSQATVAGYKAVAPRRGPQPEAVPDADDRGRDDRARARPRSRGRRRRAAGDRDGATARSRRVRVRRATGGRRAGRVARRVVPRPRRAR